MKLIVDIPKEIYEALVINQYCGSKSNLENIIVNGTPLPEHHGRLIDADSLMERFENEQDYYDKSESPLDELSIAFDNGIICAMEKLDEAPTIIGRNDNEKRICANCLFYGTNACSRGSDRAVGDKVCEDFSFI